MLENLVRDLKHALRGIRRSPGFAMAVVVTLALGIGLDWQRQARSFQAMAAWNTAAATLTGAGEAEPLNGQVRADGRPGSSR